MFKSETEKIINIIEITKNKRKIIDGEANALINVRLATALMLGYFDRLFCIYYILDVIVSYRSWGILSSVLRRNVF